MRAGRRGGRLGAFSGGRAASKQEAREMREKMGLPRHRLQAYEFAERAHPDLGHVPALPNGVRVFNAALPSNEVDGRVLASFTHDDVQDPTGANNVANNTRRAVNAPGIVGAKVLRAYHFPDGEIGRRLLATNSITSEEMAPNAIKNAQVQKESLDFDRINPKTTEGLARRGDTEYKNLKELENGLKAYMKRNYKSK